MDLRRLAFAVLPVVGAAAVGSLGSRGAPRTYARLDKPAWAPPAAAFGPVWTTLYAATAVAGWRVHASTPRNRRLHLAQLALNAAWPAAFFGVRRKGVSLAVVAALDATLAAEIVALARRDRTAAALLVPYLGWSGFATALNAAVSEPDRLPA
jgi:tryptophan-rich sensory protein